MRERRPFERWLAATHSPGEPQAAWRSFESAYYNRRGPRDTHDEALEAYCAETVSQLRNGIHVNRLFSDVPGPVVLDLPALPALEANELRFRSTPRAVVRNLRVAVLELNSGNQFQLENLYIGMLFIAHTANVEIRNCWIGDLHFSGSITNFYMYGGGANTIHCAAPGTPNPFGGSVYFDQKVDFKRTINDSIARIQSYRNMRAHMLALQNTPAANLFHTLEQASERRLDPLTSVNRFVSWAYEQLSDYGSSAARPLKWFGLLLLLTCVLIFVSDGAQLEESGPHLGWHAELVGHDIRARALRSFVLTMQATVNPLWVLNANALITAERSLLALWLAAQGVASYLLLALFIFAIRRRFKMS